MAETVRQAEQVDDEQHPYVACQQRPGYLAPDLRTFPLSLVEVWKRMTRCTAGRSQGYLIDNAAHPAELLVQLALCMLASSSPTWRRPRSA
jgi:hypothetical protein